MDADAVIEALQLERLGFEGGFYRETYRRENPSSSAIYYLLTPSSRSMMHRLQADEVYHFYQGDPVSMLLIHEDAKAETVRLGSNLMGGEVVQKLVPAGTWQGSFLEPGGRFALMGTTMTPGFSLGGFELGRRSELVSAYPEQAILLRELTPAVFETETVEVVAATADLVSAELRGLAPLLKGLSALGAEGWPWFEASRLTAFLDGLVLSEPVPFWYVVRKVDRMLVGTFERGGRCSGLFPLAEVQALDLQVEPK